MVCILLCWLNCNFNAKSTFIPGEWFTVNEMIYHLRNFMIESNCELYSVATRQSSNLDGIFRSVSLFSLREAITLETRTDAMQYMLENMELFIATAN